MATPNLKIKITSASGAKTLAMPKSTATIGSAAHCDVRLAHASVDPEHARAWLEGGRLWVQDLGSSHGTYLNGSRLPAMKPMLVRDLDALKIGESAEVLGFDKPSVDAIRAPRVAAPVVSGYEATLTEIHSAATPAPSAAPVVDDVRVRDDRARVSRELAELRLQLQMAQLERVGIKDLRTQGNELKAELSRLEDERREFKATLAQNREAEAARQQRVETELKDKRAQTEKELREMRDTQGRKLGQWKLDVVGEVNRQVRALFQEKSQRLIKTPVTAQMLHGFETEVASLVHGLILEEESHGGVVAEITRSNAAPMPTTPAAAANRGSAMRKAAGAGLVVALVAGGIEFYRLRGANSRQPASASNWRPAKTNTAKPSVTENVIYTTNYVELVQSPTWRKVRGGELARAPWNFDQRTVDALLKRETTLVQDLVAIESHQVAGKEQDTITAMHTREADYSRALLASFAGDAATYQKFVQTRTATLAAILKNH